MSTGAADSVLLEVEGLRKRFGAIVVADDISLSISDGGCVGLIGPNGAGKSSLFGMLTGAIAQDQGTIRFRGADLKGLRTHDRARLGIVRAFQIPQPFPHLSVYEHALAAACFGAGLSTRTADAWVDSVLVRTGLQSKANVLGGHLRLLDRKRLELAKAIASKAKLLLLDEIAGGLTEGEVESLVGLIESLKQDHAMIWVEHIPHALRVVADRIVVLHFGRKVLDGRPDEVMHSEIVREIYMGISADAA